ncbi:lytic transglycosylase domain-containing protein [Methylobacterium oxalidis]|uniref:Transglycosylase SLT domain-containing protein n=1 Tax=Methylobacterium oxalidis TaxID=944322 RepID=A0A512J5Q0_9HYPH|nr:hypothetical protein MOX02_33260 [Methylobacterium oxalidis]GJE29988.1 hypothetical protein LDDCCGHA_0151 [Methylobacterium oxalidis]GLS64668.1 hypothetical protein GCM10007888_30490 [Methylobacterium oxalidis]
MRALRQTCEGEYRAGMARRVRVRTVRRALLGGAAASALAGVFILMPSGLTDRAALRPFRPATRLAFPEPEPARSLPSLVSLTMVTGPAHAYARRHPSDGSGPQLEATPFQTVEDAWTAAFFGDRQRMVAFIADAAVVNGLPVEFLMRLLRQESGLNHQAVSRAGAQGVAQFMPATASERGLADPFNPYEAIPKSAELLREHRIRFGNLGLAAAAYNAGAQRVRDWLAGRSSLPRETRAYVAQVTGRAADEWRQGEDVLASADPLAGISLR